MTKLPVISAQDVIRALGRIGYEINHQKGSHIQIILNRHPYTPITIPNHHEIDKGTLRDVIRRAGLSVEEFHELL